MFDIHEYKLKTPFIGTLFRFVLFLKRLFCVEIMYVVKISMCFDFIILLKLKLFVNFF